MSQLNFYKYATWALLFLNLAVLVFFILTRPRHHHHPSTKDFRSEVINILNLNDQQQSAFRKLAHEHNQSMIMLKEQQQDLLPPYFANLAEPSESIDPDKILTKFQQLEREKIEVTYQHFQDIKNLLNQEQLPYFKGLMGKLIDELLLEKQVPPSPPKDIK